MSNPSTSIKVTTKIGKPVIIVIQTKTANMISWLTRAANDKLIKFTNEYLILTGR